MREEKFLRYNNEKLMKNLLDVEDHLRNLSEFKADEGHSSCVLKHMLLIESNAEEAISHSTVIKPENTNIYRKVLSSTKKLRSSVRRNAVSPGEAIILVRGIRKLVEKGEPSYDTSACKACEIKSDKENIYILGNLNSIKHKEQTEKTGEINMVVMKDLLYIGGGALLGRAVQEGADYADTVGSVVPGVRNSDIVDVVGGAALLIAGLKFIKKPEYQLVATIAGANVLVDKAIDMAKGVIPTGVGLAVPLSVPVIRAIAPSTTAVRGYERAMLF